MRRCTIGTFAICSDHHDDGPHGHAGGHAVGISTIDGHSIASPSARAVVMQADKELHNAGALVPRQLITGGVGNMIDQTIESLTIPSPVVVPAAAQVLAVQRDCPARSAPAAACLHGAR
jgi:hypothetical protein